MRHPNEEGWNAQREHLRTLANELIKCGPITDADILYTALLSVHMEGQQFALQTMRNDFEKALFPKGRN